MNSVEENKSGNIVLNTEPLDMYITSLVEEVKLWELSLHKLNLFLDKCTLDGNHPTLSVCFFPTLFVSLQKKLYVPDLWYARMCEHFEWM